MINKIKVIYSENFRDILYSLDLNDWLNIENIFDVQDYDSQWIVENFYKDESGKDWIELIKIDKFNLRKKIKIKIGRFLSSLNEYGLDYKPHQIDDMVNELLTYHTQNIIISKGTEYLKYIYNSKNYYREKDIKKGTLISSCMRYEYKQKYLDFYLGCSNLRTIHIEKDGKVMARALVWNTEQNEIFMDRVYYTHKYEEKILHNLAKKNNWLYYLGNTGDYCIIKKDEEYDELMSVLFDNNSEYFPFLDTIKYYDPINMRLSNRPFSNLSLLLNNTDGISSIENADKKYVSKFLHTKEIDKILYKGCMNLLQHFSSELSLENKINCLKKEIDIFNKNDTIGNTYLLDNMYKWISLKNDRFISNINHESLMIFFHKKNIESPDLYKKDFTFNRFFDCLKNVIFVGTPQTDQIIHDYKNLIVPKLNINNKIHLIHQMVNTNCYFDIFDYDFYYELSKSSILDLGVQFQNYVIINKLLDENFKYDSINKLKKGIKLNKKELYLFIHFYNKQSSKYRSIGKSINDTNKKYLEYYRKERNPIPKGTPLKYRKGFIEIFRWLILN